MGIKFTTGPDGKLWQLPDQQFANLYWFRKDWFDDPDLKAKFKEKYGYDLGVPVNWSAYEDIADFFTNDVKEIDGVKVYGHMDYGKRAPDLGWRMTDAWLSMAGEADVGQPNGRPIDEWGIRMEKDSCNPVGASVSRGGERQQPGRGLRRHQVGRVAAGSTRLRAPPTSTSTSRCRRSPGQRRPADLLVHRLHRLDGGAEERRATTPSTTTASRCGGWRRRRTARTGRKARSAATRTSAPGPVQLDPGRSPQGGLALRPVRRLEDGRREEEPGRPDLHPRQHSASRVASPSARPSSAA